MDIIQYSGIEKKIREIRSQKIILDFDVSELYGIETKKLNQAVSRNLERFPEDFIFELTDDEWKLLRSQFVTSIKGGRTYKPRAFTELGLYMLSSILNSTQAIETSITIMRAFKQIREATRTIVEIVKNPENEEKRKTLLTKVGNMLGKVIMPTENELEVIEKERNFEFSILTSFKFTDKTKYVKKKSS
ncbi:MAG: hypothetical protein QG673_1438 [Pseudomonadota bacterium]|nr:hypothetical protein [Pseudomonadota bacterium]